jgi:D-inositol-3-phosphate glycosyltransferase
MKVISIGPAHPLRGGIANFNESLAQAFAALGHQSSIVSYSLQYPAVLFPGTSQYTADPCACTLSIKHKINSINPFSWLAAGLYIRRQKPDLIVIHAWMPFFGPAMGTIARIASLNTSAKVVYLCHNVKPHEPRIADKLLNRYYLNSGHGFAAMSHSVAQDIEALRQGSKAEVSPHPIYDIFGQPCSRETALAALGLAPQYRYILFFGMVRRYKGLDLLAEAFAQSAQADSRLRLLVAGEFYEGRDEFEQQMIKLGISGKTTVCDNFIAAESVKHYFCAADIVAQTYRSATQSGVTQIAYNFGRPMLVTAVGGLAEIVPPEVGFVAQPNPGDIARKLTKFFSEQLEPQMSAAALEARGRFSWKSMAGAVVRAAGI